MKTVRVLGVGLLAAAAMMTQTAQWFFSWWMQAVPFHAFGAALEAISPSVNATTGYGGVALLVLVLTCLGIGLVASATLYAAIDERVAMTWKAWRLRNESGDYPQSLKAKYLPRWACARP